MSKGIKQFKLCIKCNNQLNKNGSCPYCDFGMRKYKPETPFKVDGNIVYNLHQDGWDKGEPLMVNDVFINIQGNHLSDEIKAEIMGIIQETLNKEYISGSPRKYIRE